MGFGFERRVFQGAIVGAVMAVSGTAGAYRTGHDIAALADTDRVRWQAKEIHFEFNDAVPGNLRIGDVMQGFDDAYANWTSLGCGIPYFKSDGPVGRSAKRGDGFNTIEWVSTGWAARGFAADSEAVTDVQYSREAGGDWEIIEADLYLNSESFSWALGASSDPKLRDLHSVAFHEMGHVIGLLHPCETDGFGGAPKCSTDPAFASTVMYPLYYSPRTMSADDQDGACFLYPRVDCGAGCASICGDAVAADRCGCESCGTDGGTQVPPISPGDGGKPSDKKTGGPGDPCHAYVDCESGVCADGLCSHLCDSESECASTQRCDATAHICIGPGKKLGEACSEAGECVGGKCVAGTTQGNVCSRPCGVDQPECPESWFCQEVSGEQVCTPPVLVATGGGGCTVVESPVSTQSAVSTLAFFGLAWFRRRKRRLRSPSQSGALPGKSC